MKSFEYTVKCPAGLHALLAAKLSQMASGYQSKISVLKDGHSANARHIMDLMILAVKQDEEIRFEIEGSDEELACLSLAAFCRNNL